MKRAIVVALILNAMLLAARAWQALPVAEGVGPRQADDPCTGDPTGYSVDTNADAAVDLSDAVYLLRWLFAGGAPPALCLPKSDGGPPGLPDTGLLCYRACATLTCHGQDGFYQTGCPNDGRFVINGDGTATDNCTGLMWQEQTADLNGDGAGNDADKVLWCEAIDYCENLTFAGHDDWRLPNVRELESIVDYGRQGPSIDPVFGAVSDLYASSSPFVTGPGSLWVIDFNDGKSSHPGNNTPVHVRAVRVAP